jgi:ATP-binding cassette subfamily E protein 1
VNLPIELDTASLSHQYGENMFRIYHLPIMRQGNVMGFLGQNGIGKSTIMNILSGDIIPNFGNYDKIAKPDAVIKHFKGNEIQKYYQKLYKKQVKISKKIQNIDLIAQSEDGNIIVKDYLDDIKDHDLGHLSDKKLNELSGG